MSDTRIAQLGETQGNPMTTPATLTVEQAVRIRQEMLDRCQGCDGEHSHHRDDCPTGDCDACDCWPHAFGRALSLLDVVEHERDALRTANAELTARMERLAAALRLVMPRVLESTPMRPVKDDTNWGSGWRAAVAEIAAHVEPVVREALATPPKEKL